MPREPRIMDIATPTKRVNIDLPLEAWERLHRISKALARRHGSSSTLQKTILHLIEQYPLDQRAVAAIDGNGTNGGGY